MTTAARAVATIAFAALVCLPVHARADGNSVAAEALFNEGRTMLEKGRVEEACDRFARSEQLEAAVGTLLNLGECYERLNKVATAWGAYRQASALAVTRNDEPRAALARTAASRIERRLSRVTLAVDQAVPGLSVTRNGTKVEPATFGTSIPIDPGTHVFEAVAPGHKPWRTTLEIAEGETNTVRVPDLEPAPSSSPPAPAPVVRPAESEPSSGQSKLALGLEVGGGVVVVAGLVFGGFAISKWSSVTDACPARRCANEADRERLSHDADAASTFATVSTVTMAVGGAAFVTGVVLHLTAPKSRVIVAPSADQGGVRVAATLRF
jgi:hypothetical protein